MSGGFSDAERERIREQLLAEGERLFARYGLKKTTIADLTDPVGIADSTFYQFFDSKEALYLEILDAQGEAIAERVVGRSFERYDDPERAITAFLTLLMDEIETNPLVRRLIVDPDELDRLRQELSPEERAESRQESIAYFLPYVREWYDRGQIRGPDPETIAHAIRAVTMLTLHREDVGAEHYPAARNLVIEAVAAGLVVDGSGDGIDDADDSDEQAHDENADDR